MVLDRSRWYVVFLIPILDKCGNSETQRCHNFNLITSLLSSDDLDGFHELSQHALPFYRAAAPLKHAQITTWCVVQREPPRDVKTQNSGHLMNKKGEKEVGGGGGLGRSGS